MSVLRSNADCQLLLHTVGLLQAFRCAATRCSTGMPEDYLAWFGRVTDSQGLQLRQLGARRAPHGTISDIRGAAAL